MTEGMARTCEVDDGDLSRRLVLRKRHVWMLDWEESTEARFCAYLLHDSVVKPVIIEAWYIHGGRWIGRATNQEVLL